MQRIRLVLPFPPSVNRLWRTTGAGGMYRSPKYAAWRKQALWNVHIQVKGRQIVGPYKLTVLVVRPDKRRRDLDNLFKAASDVLVEMKVIEGDHLCEWLEARWVESGPECEIILETINGKDT